MVTIRIEDAMAIAAAVERWLPIIRSLAEMGVKAWTAIEAVLLDAGADDATIDALQPQWDALVDDVQRASLPPVEAAGG